MSYIINFVVLTIILSIVIDMAASQPNKPTRKWDDEGERPGWWKEAARKVREKEAAEQARKEEEARLARIAEYHRGRIEVVRGRHGLLLKPRHRGN